MTEKLQHLVLVRHGESEGDKRREAWKRGEQFVGLKRPEHEEITTLGAEQSARDGQWITEHILGHYAMKAFDGYFVSTSLRSEQSAVAMGFESAVWLEDKRLDERNRGRIRGIKPEQHRKLFPDSYEKMQADPLSWIPPGGESMLDVVERFQNFYDDSKEFRSLILVGHRDQMWGARQPLECLSLEELLAINTDLIHNGQIVHYTSIDPTTGRQAPDLIWMRTVDPMQPEASAGWQILPHIAERYGYAA